MARASPLLLVSEECKYAASFSANLLITLQETTKTSLIGSEASNSFLQHSVSMFFGSLSSMYGSVCSPVNVLILNLKGVIFFWSKKIVRGREKRLGKIECKLQTSVCCYVSLCINIQHGSIQS